MAEYDFAGRTEKTSISGGGSPGTDLYYKPRSFKLNKYITLKCSKVRTNRDGTRENQCFQHWL